MVSIKHFWTIIVAEHTPIHNSNKKLIRTLPMKEGFFIIRVFIFMDQSLKKILHKIWDKYQVYDEKLIRKFLTGYKELDSIELRNEFRNWLGGDDAVFNKVEEFLSKPKHARVGGYDFDYKPINWDINVSNNHDMWVELDSSVVDANGKVTLDGYDGNTYDIGEVMSEEEFSGEDSISWEVDDEINDIIKDQLRDLLMKNFGVDLIYYHNLVYDDQAFDKSLRENVSKIKKIVISEIQYHRLYESGEIKERCWKGYTQKGMKTMFGKRYPNCVKKTK